MNRFSLSINLNLVFQVALQVGFLKVFEDVATVVLDLVLSQFVLFLHVIPDRLDDGEIRSYQLLYIYMRNCGSDNFFSPYF